MIWENLDICHFCRGWAQWGQKLAFLPCCILGPRGEAGERLWAPAESLPHPVFSTGQLWDKKITKSFPSGKETTCQCRRHQFYRWVKKIPWKKKWKPTLVFLPGKSQGQRSLAVYSLWCHKRVRYDLGTKTTTKKLADFPEAFSLCIDWVLYSLFYKFSPSTLSM